MDASTTGNEGSKLTTDRRGTEKQAQKEMFRIGFATKQKDVRINTKLEGV